MSKKSCGNCRFWGGTCKGYAACQRFPASPISSSSSSHPLHFDCDWCGEWRPFASNDVRGKLYQLPNGQHIYPDDVRGVATLKGGYSSDARADLAPRVQVRLCDRGLHIIPCDTLEAAESMRDKIAADVNAMLGGAA